MSQGATTATPKSSRVVSQNNHFLERLAYLMFLLVSTISVLAIISLNPSLIVSIVLASVATTFGLSGLIVLSLDPVLGKPIQVVCRVIDAHTQTPEPKQALFYTIEPTRPGTYTLMPTYED